MQENSTTHKRILGIDPGINGGFFLLDDGAPSKWAIMPTISKDAGFKKSAGRLVHDDEGNKIQRHKTEVDPVTMVAIFREFAPQYIILEEVGAMPGQGVTSMFSFGRSFGDVRTAGAWLGCPLVVVRPQAWQKVMFKGFPASDTKEISARVVSKLWPGLDLRKTKRSKKPHDGMCDAACMAEYARRLLQEGSAPRPEEDNRGTIGVKENVINPENQVPPAG